MSQSSIYQAKGLLDAASAAERAADIWFDTHGGRTSPIARGGFKALMAFSDKCRDMAYTKRRETPTSARSVAEEPNSSEGVNPNVPRHPMGEE